MLMQSRTRESSPRTDRCRCPSTPPDIGRPDYGGLAVTPLSSSGTLARELRRATTAAVFCPDRAGRRDRVRADSRVGRTSALRARSGVRCRSTNKAVTPTRWTMTARGAKRTRLRRGCLRRNPAARSGLRASAFAIGVLSHRTIPMATERSSGIVGIGSPPRSLSLRGACLASASRQPHRAPARSAPERSGLLRVSPAAAHAHSLLETAVRDAVRHRRAREPSSPGGGAAPAYIGTDRAPSVVTSAPLAAICEPPALVGSGRGEEEPSGRCLGSGADPLPARVSRAQPGSRRPARRCADRRSRSRPAWC
jgi:hypothetical protein